MTQLFFLVMARPVLRLCRGYEAQSVEPWQAGTDDEVLALARSGTAGDFRAAAAALFRRHFRELYGHVRSRLPEDETAVQDILQEVALAVVEGLPRLREGASVRPWLLQIASHKVCDHLRRTVRERRRIDRDLTGAVMEHLEDPSGHMDTLLERAGEAQLAAYLRRAVDKLNPHQQEAVRLVYFDGVPLDEAATRLGLRNDALASLLYRARKAFTKELERERRAQDSDLSAPLRPSASPTPGVPPVGRTPVSTAKLVRREGSGVFAAAVAWVKK